MPPSVCSKASEVRANLEVLGEAASPYEREQREHERAE